LDTYLLLDCQDYGRVEIRMDRYGNPYVLELNANPSLNENACLPTVFKLLNKNYGDLIERIIFNSIKRYQKKVIDYKLK